MKRFLFAAAITVMTILTTQDVNAQSQRRQSTRINQGVRSGELTRHEARNLRHNQEMLRREKKMAWADGRLTRAERARIDRLERRNSVAIYQQKHDRQDRW